MMFEKSEQYFAAKDEFRRYVAEEVNPVRIANGLEPIDDRAAGECFRIVDNLYDPATKTLSTRNVPSMEEFRRHIGKASS